MKNAFRAAKKHLAHSTRDGRALFICCALDDAYRAGEAAVVNARLGPCATLESWLRPQHTNH